MIARAFPPDQVRQILTETSKASERERDLPAQVMVYYAIALALYMGSSTREVLRCLPQGVEAGPGWIALRKCPLGDNGPRVTLALVHGGVGVALVEFEAKETDAARRLRRALDARRFPAIFGGYPPIVQVVLPASSSTELGRVVAAFEAQPPLALAGGDAWVRTARAAIEAKPPAAVPEPPRTGQRHAFPWRAAIVLAVVGGTSAAALALVFALPGRDPGNATRGPAIVAFASAPGTAPDLPREAASEDDGHTAWDVAAALISAETAAAGGEEAATGLTEPGSAPKAMMAADGNRAEPALAAPDTASIPQLEPVWPGTALSDAPGGTPKLQAPAASAAGAGRPEEFGGGAPATATAGEATTALPVAVAAPVHDGVGGGRCRGIVVRSTMGGALSDDDREFLRRGCQPPG